MRKFYLLIILFAFFLLDAAVQSSGQAAQVMAKAKANRAPIIKSITPPNNSTFLAGAKVIIEVMAFDPDKDSLEYQFSFGGTIKQAWSTWHCYTWQTSAADRGDINITCEVRDNKGAIASRTIAYHVINPTVEDALQKLKDNVTKITDLKADMTLASSLNGKPFGETEYCRYYFKAPARDDPILREKTETFSDGTITAKTESVIIQGSDMYVIDPINKTTKHFDLLFETGLTSSQFSQTDMLYNLNSFSDNHLLSKNDIDTDFLHKIIAINAVPKEPNSLYSKLGLFIDYNKGVLVKSTLYAKNASGQEELMQTIETTKAIRMPNDAWLPIKMKKTPNNADGNFFSTVNYANPEVNTGLIAVDFDPAKQY